jgi:ribosomal protein L24E
MADQATCSFCGKASERGVEGPNGRYACWDCLVHAREVIGFMQKTYTCSFCMETVPSTAVVEGPNDIYMCASCVDSGMKLLNR